MNKIIWRRGTWSYSRLPLQLWDALGEDDLAILSQIHFSLWKWPIMAFFFFKVICPSNLSQKHAYDVFKRGWQCPLQTVWVRMPTTPRHTLQSPRKEDIQHLLIRLPFLFSASVLYIDQDDILRIQFTPLQPEPNKTSATSCLWNKPICPAQLKQSPTPAFQYNSYWSPLTGVFAIHSCP